MDMAVARTERPLVSVITVCRNSERYLRQTMESVLAQTYPEIEYVVIDGGSTDGTLAIIRSFEPRFAGRLRWMSEPDDGIYHAMNKGIAQSSGELVGILNSDDAYTPDAIEVAVAAWLKTGRPGAVYGDAVILDESGRELRVEESLAVSSGDRPDRMPMCHQALFVTAETYRRLGAYDTSFRILADYELVLRMLREGVAMTRVPAVLACFRTGGVCSADMDSANAERERIRVAYGASPLFERFRRARHFVNNRIYSLLVTFRGGNKGREKDR